MLVIAGVAIVVVVAGAVVDHSFPQQMRTVLPDSTTIRSTLLPRGLPWQQQQHQEVEGDDESVIQAKARALAHGHAHGNNNNNNNNKVVKKKKKTKSDPKIVGGIPVPKGKYPFFAWTGLAGPQYCGGTLIHSDIVLTAAHCQLAWNSTGQFVYLGVTDDTGDNGQLRQVAKLLVHPKYNAATTQNDIMLLKLNFPSLLPTVNLNKKPKFPSTGAPVSVTGFGRTSETATTIAPILWEAQVQVIANRDCNAYYEASTLQLAISKTTQICAGLAAGGKDACQGDDGGPLLSSNYVQVGIVSFAYPGCARPGVPTVYTRVSGFYDWIQSSICSLSSAPPSSCLPTNQPAMAPTKSPSPVDTLVYQCVKMIVPECNCGLHFKGSKCVQTKVKTMCQRPPKSVMKKSAFSKLVGKRYNSLCRA